MSPIERAALLKCRYADRYDDLTQKGPIPTLTEALEEQAAMSVNISPDVFSKLVGKGLLEHRADNRLRLTAAGKSALLEKP